MPACSQGRTQDEKFSEAKKFPSIRSRAAGAETRHKSAEGVGSGEGLALFPVGAWGFDTWTFFENNTFKTLILVHFKTICSDSASAAILHS